MTNDTKEKTFSEILDPIVDSHKHTLKVIMDVYKSHPSESIAAITMCVVYLLDLVWYDSPSTGKATMLSNIFKMLEKKCTIYDEIEKQSSDIKLKEGEEVVKK